MYYLLYDDDTDALLYNGSAEAQLLNVKVQANDNSGNIMLIMVALIAVVVILGILVMVLIRRDTSGSETFDDDEYEDYDDGKQVVDIPANAPSSPPSNLDPEMVRAMEVFPQWTQEQIQEYFDMGWNVESLLEWVNNQ